MSSYSASLPVLDVDVVLGTTPPALPPAQGPGDQAPTVSSVLAEVLGWRPRVDAPQAFVAALDASFLLHTSEGVRLARYVPHAFSVQADLGGVTGGQASLYARARSALSTATPLLTALAPLRADADDDDCAAFRGLVQHGLEQLVEELGLPGGPRAAVVDASFDLLAGSTAGEGPGRVARGTADDVPGWLGALRDSHGLDADHVNSPEEEGVRTSFWTLVDLVLDLRRSWQEQRDDLSGTGGGNGFLGTELVQVSRLLSAAAEQLDELERVLSASGVPPSVRATTFPVRGSGLSVDGLVSWLRRFLLQDGPMYVRESGRDGVRTAFLPVAGQLLHAVTTHLLAPVGGLGQGRDNGPVVVLPLSGPLPAGMASGRVRLAVSGLHRVLRELYVRAARIGRYDGVVLQEVEVRALGGSDSAPSVLVCVRGAGLRPGYLPVLAGASVAQHPEPGTATGDADTLTGVFVLREDSGRRFAARLARLPGAAVLLPADVVPVGVAVPESGALAARPATDLWPELDEVAGPAPGQDDGDLEVSVIDLTSETPGPTRRESAAPRQGRGRPAPRTAGPAAARSKDDALVPAGARTAKDDVGADGSAVPESPAAGPGPTKSATAQRPPIEES